MLSGRMVTRRPDLDDHASLATLQPGPPVWSDYRQVQQESSLREWIVTLRKRRMVVAVTVLIITTLSFLASMRMTRLYRAETKIAINRESSDVLGFKDIGGNGATDDDAADYNVSIDTQINIIQSDVLALAVIRELKLNERPYFTGKIDNESKNPYANEGSTFVP